MNRTIQVERRSRYGRQCMLPVNDPARLIAEIAGTTELRPKDLVAAARLGFKVVRVDRLSDGVTIVEVEELSP